MSMTARLCTSYLRNRTSELYQFFYECCLWLASLLAFCDTLLIFSFMHDVIFYYNEHYGCMMLLQQFCCNDVNRLIPVLCGIDCVLS